MTFRIPHSSRPTTASPALAVVSALVMLFAMATLVSVPAGPAQAQEEKARQVQALRDHADPAGPPAVVPRRRRVQRLAL